jgi:farnesyl diphosphate synthase
VGTDIQDNKCSWLVVQALDRVTLEQRRVLEDWDDVKVMNVKALFKELDMVKVFEDYEI